MAFEKLAEIIFPNVEHDREYYIAKYPKRNLKEGARVTRYAPSPTGFQHIGGVFAALINERLASQSEGVFYLRIEDTDQKREVEGAIEDTIATMHNFGMDFSEGMTGQETSKGEYGPYRQSERAEIYRTFAKDLLFFQIKALYNLELYDNVIENANAWIKAYSSDDDIPEMLYMLGNTYGNIHFDVKLQVSRKCDLCGGKPKCVGHCIAAALNYEEIEDYSARVRKRVDIQLAERMKS